MDLWEIILFFWAPISRHIGYFKDLDNNVETLERKTKKLKRKHDEIQAKVGDAIPVGKRQKAHVQNWLTEVRNTENQVDSIRLELALRRICTDHLSRYTLGKRVVEKLEDIEKLNKKLKVKGVFHEVAESSRHPRVLEKQTSLPRGQQSTSERTLEEIWQCLHEEENGVTDRTLEEIWQCLHEEENGIIGIYGMDGIGKTTLMEKIKNRCTETRDFDVIIWITVSKFNCGLIQEKIGNSLGMKFENEDKRDKMFSRLKNLRYLLILDDLWEAFSLVQVGIPNPDKQNRCKIAITSESVAVCNAMGADKSIKVRALAPESSRHPRVSEKQTSLPQGQQSTSETLEEIWQCLNEEENGIIGICGMGGIGKTTLMKEISNRCIKTRDFDAVIWITVSKDLNLGLIQEEIGNRLRVKFHGNEDKEDKLFAELKNLSYLLILDDLWKSFSLDQVGIPKPDKQNRCKIVITSRSVAVCNAMGADKSIKVRALTPEEAWNLFCERCGDVVLSSEIRPVAEEVAKECSGLPLAINTVGVAMRGKDKKEVWENALRAMKGASPEVRALKGASPEVRAMKGASPEVPGMEREVFLSLKHSYDSLKNEEIKSCFLYCSLFPEEYKIPIDELVRCWAAEEGFIENVNNLEEASNKGHDILERIKDACLLEKVTTSFGNEYVRMHDLLRDLAIWITSPSSSMEGSKFLVKAGEGLVQPPEEKMWRGVVRISLMRNKIKDLQITPDCPNLVSLFLNQNNELRTIHSDFFERMPKLQILDLSYTGIESLPMSLLQLVNLRVLILRHCRGLVEVPPLGKLKELQILDLSGSGLENYPQGIESLVKLKRLDISETSFAIPYTTIYGLPSLEEVSMINSNVHVDGATFSEAVNMKRLRSLRISLSNLNGFIAHDMFHRWFSGLTSFLVEVNKLLYYPTISNKQISICECDKFPCGIEGLIKHAFSLCLYKCKGLTSLSKIQGDLKGLRHLDVSDCRGVECIIDWREVGDDAFQCLQSLDLFDLPNLEKVFDGGAPPPLNTSLQNLRIIRVDYCEKLRSLFSSSMVEQLHQLEVLYISDCSQMKEIIEGDKLPHNSFPKLCILELDDLPELESICSQRFMFISLEEMKVISCPKLKKLPLFSSSIHQIKGKIEGKREWWEGLEWEDEEARSLCSTIYKEASSEVEEEHFSE